MEIFEYIKKSKKLKNNSLFRKGKDRYKLRSISAPRLPSGAETVLLHNRSCQTIVIDQNPPIPAARTNPPPMAAQGDTAWTPTSETPSSTPTNCDIAAKAKTITTLTPNPAIGATSVDEYFFFRQSRRSDPDRDLGYRQYSEYNVDARGRSIEKINSYLDISDSSRPLNKTTSSSPRHQASYHQIPVNIKRAYEPKPTHHQQVVDIRDLKRGRQAGKKPAKLSQSTIETTSVVANKTKVQGITVKDSSPDKFTIHIVNPNGYESIMKHENAPATGEILTYPSDHLDHHLTFYTDIAKI